MVYVLRGYTDMIVDYEFNGYFQLPWCDYLFHSYSILNSFRDLNTPLFFGSIDQCIGVIYGYDESKFKQAYICMMRKVIFLRPNPFWAAYFASHSLW